MTPLHVVYVVLPYVWGEYIRPRSGLPWLVIVAISSLPSDPLASPLVVSYLVIHLIIASLLNVMDAVSFKGEKNA